MIDFQDVMSRNIVRGLRTCQGFAKSEATVRGLHGQISPMDSDENIGRRLIAMRERLGKSQVEIAEKLNIGKNTLNGYENAKRRLTMETATRIRDRFGISVDWLLFGDIGQPSHDVALELGPKPPIKADDKKKTPAKPPRRSATK